MGRRKTVLRSNTNLQSIPMKKNRYGVAITWDNVAGKRTVDLDIQALIIDERGVIRDAVYYNNLNAMSGGVMHSGDETTGAADGYDEMIWVTTSKLPEQIRMLIFIVAASGEGSLRDASNGMIHFVEQFLGQTLQSFKIENSMADVDVVGMMEKSPVTGKWTYVQVEAAAEDGDHFMDILEPTIGGLIRSVIPNAPKQQTLCFQMAKGAIIDLPGKSLQRLFFSISVSMTHDQDDIDLDIAAIFMNKDCKTMGCCSCDKILLWGVTHSGENDCDEDMAVDLRQVPQKVEQIFIVVNLATAESSVSFHQLAGAVCKVTDHNLKEIASFSLKNEAADEGKGLVVCRIVRLHKRWELQALGRFCEGSTWKGCVPTIKTILTEDKEATAAAKTQKAAKAEKAEKTLEAEKPAEAAAPATVAAAPAATPSSAATRSGDEKLPTAESATEEPLPLRRNGSVRRATARKNTGLFQVKITAEEISELPAPVGRKDIRRRTRPLDLKLKEVLKQEQVSQEQEQEEDKESDVFSGEDGEESNADDGIESRASSKQELGTELGSIIKQASRKLQTSSEAVNEAVNISNEDEVKYSSEIGDGHCAETKKVCEAACVCQ